MDTVKELVAENGRFDGVAEPGETLTYTVTLTNPDAVAARYDLTDNIDANVSYVGGSATVDGVGSEPTGTDPLTWSGIVVPANGTVVVVYSVTVADPIPEGVTEIGNVAYRTGDPEPDCSVRPTPVNCTVTPIAGNAVPSKSLTQESGSIPNYAEPGETLTYTVTLTNLDAVVAPYDLTDNIDENVSYVPGSATVGGVASEPAGTDPLAWGGIVVPANGSVDVVYSVTVADPIPEGVTIRNIAYEGGTPEPDCAEAPDQCVETPPLFPGSCLRRRACSRTTETAWPSRAKPSATPSR